MSKKIVAFPRFGRPGASSRYRLFQYIQFYEDAGLQVDVYPFFTDEYVRCLYADQAKPKMHVLYSFIRRFFALFNIFGADVVWIEKELFPFLPAWVELMLLLMGKKVIVDYDDAQFHRYDLHQNGIIRMIMKNKIGQIMRYSSWLSPVILILEIMPYYIGPLGWN